MNRNTLSALIGLVGAINNNGKTEQTDLVVRDAILNDSDPEMVAKVHREKFSISPNCETCQSPCGNTSDYPHENFEQWTKEQQELKDEILIESKRIAGSTDTGKELPEIVYKAISYVGYDLKTESYIKILEELKKW